MGGGFTLDNLLENWNICITVNCVKLQLVCIKQEDVFKNTITTELISFYLKFNCLITKNDFLALIKSFKDSDLIV